MDLVLRHQFESYMDCEGSYNLIGEGFTSLPENKNAKEYTRKYINYRTEKTDVIGYSPTVPYSCDMITGDPVVAEIARIHDNECVGSASHKTIVSVNRWNEASENVCVAYKRTYAVIPDTKGDGTDALIYTGTMKAVSDVTKGWFNVETKEFLESLEPQYDESKITVIELDENGERTSAIHEFTSIFDVTDFIRESSADVEVYYGDECGYTSIGTNTFYNLDNLIRVKLPNGIQSIDNNAFWNTTQLNAITTIQASIMSIGADAFHGCESLTSISINKPENSISGAPWGATNATVVWTG